MACSTGEACGLTDTRSGASRCANQSAVIRLTIEALEAWWPPTLTPERFSRTRLAWCTIEVASQSTRRCTRSSACRSRSVCAPAAVAMPITLRAERALDVQHPRGPAVGQQLGVGLLGQPGRAEAEDALGAQHPGGDRPRAQQLGVVVADDLAAVGGEHVLE